MRFREQPYSVLIGDEHAIVRAGIRHILNKLDNVGAIHEAKDAETLHRVASEMSPHLIIADVSMSDGYMLTLLPILKQQLPQTKVLVLSLAKNPDYIQQCLGCGTQAYLYKDSELSDIEAAIKAIINGESYYCANLSNCPRKTDSSLAIITERERQVLSLIVQGKANKQVALMLGISPRTVETHRSSLSRKLGITSVAQLTRFAIENGIISTPVQIQRKESSTV